MVSKSKSFNLVVRLMILLIREKERELRILDRGEYGHSGTWMKINVGICLVDRTWQVKTPKSTTIVKAVWSESVPNRMSEFLRFSVDTDRVLAVGSGGLLYCKIYEAGGAEIARESRGLITSLTKGEVRAKELVGFDYPYDITRIDRLLERPKDKKFRVVLPSDMPFLIFEQGVSLIFNILSTSTIPATAHCDTVFSYHVWLFKDSYSKYMELKA
ncbi:unnamed protein product, partial [marine sediment metagenome]